MKCVSIAVAFTLATLRASSTHAAQAALPDRWQTGRDIDTSHPPQRRRALLGIPNLSGFSPEGDGWPGGRAYEPKSGRGYRASYRLGANGTLDVTDCVLLFFRTRQRACPTMENHR
ncbi:MULTISPECIES: DUF2147 domain-containing protein [unclassified Novosphingobium]|uniref:DUF2147 domain-containing protein n=1 Tax=unclassified Novosphingobium TaxID=2644732 RepID=UPI001357B611|nr:MULTISPECIES: DUF2147 domain-containing protein [unclassified Novosphingobium]